MYGCILFYINNLDTDCESQIQYEEKIELKISEYGLIEMKQKYNNIHKNGNHIYK